MSTAAPGAAPPLKRNFAGRVIAWFRRGPSRQLPWQANRTPYRVWVSEIMLQQTQTSVVAPRFAEFMRRFPSCAALAAAGPEAVMSLWGGLGYYARARNLHKAARLVCERHAGEPPADLDALMRLPGVGRSTAGAILALGHGRRAAILDGNVKRALARHRGVEGWPGRAAVARKLWDWAERLTPKRGNGDDIADYTQAMMDLGATVCVRARPDCGACPVAADCAARLAGRIDELPAPRPRRARPTKPIVMLVATCGPRVLLERRQPRGIWGGLLSFPEIPDAGAARAWCETHIGPCLAVRRLADMTHELTHLRLEIAPVHVRVQARGRADERAAPNRLWCKLNNLAGDTPAPVKRLVAQLTA